eukprot:scaffold233585_cov26-Tisochrysis_lutea.AAC.1
MHFTQPSKRASALERAVLVQRARLQVALLSNPTPLDASTCGLFSKGLQQAGPCLCCRSGREIRQASKEQWDAQDHMSTTPGAWPVYSIHCNTRRSQDHTH